jgi:osmoprotectant transport system permease protein
MIEQLGDLTAQLPELLAWHLILSLSALGLGLLVSLPLGVLASRRPRLGETVLAVAGVVQTVPPLALLALMVPMLGGMIGFLPAFVALTLYSVLPIIANTVAGLRGVDPALIEAAQGLGMTSRQQLRRVQLPLAAPVILAGVRTATVQVVGTATLGTPVGCTGLGNYIFQGLETRNHLTIVYGCVMAALLALAMDQLVGLFKTAAQKRSRGLAVMASAILLCLIVVALSFPLSQRIAAGSDTIVVGSGPFTEQHILNDVLADRLRARGFSVEQRKGMGETIQFEALRNGTIDCYVDYSGNLWSLVLKRLDIADRQTTITEITSFLQKRDGIVCMGSLGFENAYAIAVRGQAARQNHWRSIGDLAAYAGRQKIGGDHQFFGRPEWKRVQELYGLRFAQQVAMDPGLMYAALGEGSVDVISAYSSDGRIVTDKLRILEDPKGALPPYDALLLLSKEAAAKPGVRAALEPLIGSINVERMREANRQVDQDHLAPPEAARWMARQIAASPAASSTPTETP